MMNTRKRARDLLSVMLATGLGMPATLTAVAQEQAGAVKSDPVRILFIGNSYTTYNNMPGLVRSLLESGGRKADVALYTTGGATLRDHWHHNAGEKAPDPGTRYNPSRKGGLDRLLKEKGPWNYVVLQGQSQETLNGKPCEFDTYAAKLVAMIRKAHPETRPVFYLTWARQHIPTQQPEITKAYLEAARANRALVAPAGEAWRAAFAGRQNLVLHAKDRSHPTVMGSYLVACVFYAVFTGKSPEGLPPARGGKSGHPMTEADAAFLQETAWKTVRAMGRDTGLSR